MHTRSVTPAIKELQRMSVPFSLHEYDVDESLRDFGLEASGKLGLDPDQVFKTLVVTADAGQAVAIVPVSSKLALKAVAQALGAKRAKMCDTAIAERVTGYIRGGISPFGQKQRLPTVIDEMATVFDTIYVSGGKRGLDIGVATADLVRLLDATIADIAAA
jgi:Cys-tRNA(Pro)/Cys-tRNA(Cys) deacylase